MNGRELTGTQRPMVHDYSNQFFCKLKTITIEQPPNATSRENTQRIRPAAASRFPKPNLLIADRNELMDAYHGEGCAPSGPDGGVEQARA